MSPQVLPADARQLRELCAQFEQVMITTLVPQSLFTGSTASQDSDAGDAAPSSPTTPVLFRQVLAAAIESGGGLGLAPQLARLLSGASL